MGQKCNPYGFRLGENYPYRSCWFAPKNEFGEGCIEDCFIREHIESEFYNSGIHEIYISKLLDKITIRIFCLKPNFIIGKDGEVVTSLCSLFAKKTGKKVFIYAFETKEKKISASAVAYSIEEKIKARLNARKVVRTVVQELMQDPGVEGVMIRLKGRLGGAEIARSEVTREGSVPLSSLRNIIDYKRIAIRTEYGIIGLKVFINRGKLYNKSRSSSFRVFEKEGDRNSIKKKRVRDR